MNGRGMISVAAVALLAIFVRAGIILGRSLRSSSELAPAPIGGPFELVDQDGHSFPTRPFQEGQA